MRSKAFVHYHLNNPEMYRLAIKYATEAKCSPISARLVLSRARWEIMQRTGKLPKLNNNMIREYTDFLMETQPFLKGKFLHRGGSDAHDPTTH